ncbi:MAG: ribonuclease protein component [Kribbellaceae bacterium]|nr:ribonuclease protein component [Kribbellaceae bacterium]
MHLLADGGLPPDAGPRVGFVVGKAVGNAVTRNRVKRRLRHLARERLSRVPASAVVVVRALPAASDAGYARLGDDLDKALRRVMPRYLGPEPIISSGHGGETP